MEHGKSTHGFALPGGRHDEGDLFPQEAVRPGFVVGPGPAILAEHHDGEFGTTHQFEPLGRLDQVGHLLGHGQHGFDGLPVGVDAVDRHGEPEGEAPGPPGEVVGVVGGVPLLGGVGVHDVEIRGVLGVDGLGQMGLAVEQGGTVERGKQPLVGIDDKRVDQFDSVEAGPDRGREEGGAAVGPVDVEPPLAFAGECSDAGQIVDDSGVGGAPGGHDGDHVIGPGVAIEERTDGGSGQPVVVARDEQALHAEDVGGLADRRVGFLADGDHRTLGRLGPHAVVRGVPADHQAREVPGRSARDEAATGGFGQSGLGGDHRQGLVFGHRHAGRLQPGGAVHGGRGDHHVEQHGRLGGGGRNERQVERTVAGDHGFGEMLGEDVEHPLGIGAVVVDEARHGFVESGRAGAAVVEGDRVEAQPLAAVIEDHVGQFFVVDEHRIAHGLMFPDHAADGRSPHSPIPV